MCCPGVLITGQDWRSYENEVADEGFGLVGLYKNGTEYVLKYRQTGRTPLRNGVTSLDWSN